MTSRLLIPSAVATARICLSPKVVTQPEYNDPMESGIGLAVATTVESMPVRFAG